MRSVCMNMGKPALFRSACQDVSYLSDGDTTAVLDSSMMADSNNLLRNDMGHRGEGALGQAGLHGKLSQHDRRARVLLRRLQHKRVAGCDGQREHPQRDHRREVEGADARAHLRRQDAALSAAPLGYMLLHACNAAMLSKPECEPGAPELSSRPGFA